MAAREDAAFAAHARSIWRYIEVNLDGRGCFNGIDDETMDELRNDQIARIASLLRECAAHV